MPLINIDGSPYEPQREPPVPGSIVGQPNDDLDKPTTTEVIASAVRQENVVASALTSEALGMTPNARQEGYRAWDDIVGTKYEKYWDRFADSHNARYSNALKSQIDKEEQDRRNVQAGGATGIITSIAAGVLDLPSLIPGVGLVRNAKTGVSVGKSALAIAGLGAIDASVSELALHQSQATRTKEESAFIIGFSTITSGLLGAGVAKAVGAVETKRITDAFIAESSKWVDEPNVDDIAKAYDNVMATGDLSAARTPDLFDPKDITFANKTQEIISKGALVNPMIGLLKSESKTAKEVVAQLPEMSFAMKMTNTGTSQPTAAETLVKEWTLGRVGTGLKVMDREYKALVKSGDNITRKEFSERVARAMRRNDVDERGNDFVSRVAQNWRQTLVDPLKVEAISERLLPKDVNVTTAASYFTRVYNRNKIIAQEPEFKNIVRNWARGAIQDVDARAGKQSFVSKEDYDSYIDDVADEIFNKLTGRATLGEAAFVRVANERGPLKERTFNIADDLIEDFLENDTELVMRRYARVMGGDVELAKKFGRPDLQDQIAEVSREYAEIRKKIIDDKRLKQETREKRLAALTKQEKKDIRNIEGLRDRLRGTFMLDEKTSGFGQVAQAASTLNYMRLLGGVTISSIPDIGRHIMVHGLGRFMSDGIGPLITNFKAFKLSVDEAKLAGSAAELINNSRMATWAEITDPYAYNSPFMAFLSNAGNRFSKLNGMTYWNDFQKSFASVMTQNRVLKNAVQAADNGFDSLNKKQQQYMALLGVGRGDAERIGKLFKEHGEIDGNVYLANSNSWGAADDVQAYNSLRKFRAAINKEVDTTIISKGIGDTPLLMDQPIWNLVLQFKSFMLASHQRMLMRAATDEAAGVMSGMMTLAGVGMLTYALKQIETGRELSDNPGKWLAEGIDRSGMLAMFTEYNNIAEKLGLPGFYDTLQGVFPDADQSAPASRYAQRNLIGSLLGPSFGLAQDLVTSIGASTRYARDTFKGKDPEFSDAERRTSLGLLPGQNLPIIKSILHHQ